MGIHKTAPANCEHCGVTYAVRIPRKTRFCSLACFHGHCKRDPEELFWSHVAKSDGCWLWTAGLNRGYGAFAVHRKDIGAHRYSWMLENGPIPDGLFVLHRCDNPPCVRPDHLFIGTQLDNMLDKMSKGRGYEGDRHYLRQNPERVRRGSDHLFDPLASLR